MPKTFQKSLCFLLLASLAACTPSNAPESGGAGDAAEKPLKFSSLPSLGADSNSVSVSGISAGAFMATQLQVAFSSLFIGAGSIAGGPWNCSEGYSWYAVTRCMENTREIDVQKILSDVREAEQRGDIDPLTNLAKARVYMLNSENDTVVKSPMRDKNSEFFSSLVPRDQLKVETSVASEHTFPTLSYGSDCDTLASPYISKCDFDTAGALLSQIYSGRALSRGLARAQSLHRFDQSEFDQEGNASLAEEGWVYIPQSCEAAGSSCAVHVALHGCSQGSDAIKDAFVLNAGYNEWAEASGIIVLYPQTYARAFINPKGCFDWWGYTNSKFATKSAPQMRAIVGMVRRLATVRK